MPAIRFFRDYHAAHGQGGTNTKQRNLRHLFTGLEDRYDHPHPYTDDLNRYAPVRTRPSTLSANFIKDLLEVTGNGPGRSFPDVRDHALIRLLCEGLRRTEIVQMCLDEFVSREVLKVLSPAAAEARLQAIAQELADRAALEKLWRQRLERAGQDADRARRCCRLAEPENRLVMRQLEGEWETALARQRDLEEQWHRFQRRAPDHLTPAQEQAIRAAARDLPQLWAPAPLDNPRPAREGQRAARPARENARPANPRSPTLRRGAHERHPIGAACLTSRIGPLGRGTAYAEDANTGYAGNGPQIMATGGRGSAGSRSYTSTDFRIDWDARQATCPQGKTSSRWIETAVNGEPRARIDFYRAGCPSCPARAQCTTARFRVLTVHPREQYEALQARRAGQETDAWKARYATRAGVEGTIAQAVHRVGARRARYRGLPKARLHTILAAAALNLIRLDAWLTGTPLATTRTSRFSQLALALTA